MERMRTRPTLRQITHISAHANGQRVEWICSATRGTRAIAEARLMCFLVATEAGLHCTRIAAYYGRDRTTVVAGIAQARAKARADHNFAMRLHAMRRALDAHAGSDRLPDVMLVFSGGRWEISGPTRKDRELQTKLRA